MTTNASAPYLVPKEYPEFEQTVGNSFASSYPEQIQKDETDLKRLANVSQGLFKIYENVIDDAAKGAPMTPHDSAVIATTVANMTSSVGVESHVERVPSLESRYDQHLGFIVTQESLSQTIKSTIVAFLKAFQALLVKIGKWVSHWINSARDKSQGLVRLLNTAQRWSNIAMPSVKYTPNMHGILVDSQIPAEWFGKVATTLNVITALMTEQTKMANHGVELLDSMIAAKITPDNAEQLKKEIDRKVDTAPKVTLGRYKSREASDSQREIEWSEPLCGNTVAIAMNPTGTEAIDAVNYGASLIPVGMAKEFGVKTNYSESEPTDSVVTVDLDDYNRNQRSVNTAVTTAGRELAHLNQLVDRLSDKMSKVNEKFRQVELDENSDNESVQDLLTYAGVARSIVSAALASARFNFDSYSTVVDGTIAVFGALNKKHGSA